jgi:hypothetical protein
MHNQTRLEERWAALERFVWEELERTRVWALTAGTRDETEALLVKVRRRIQRAIVFAAAGQWGHRAWSGAVWSAGRSCCRTNRSQRPMQSTITRRSWAEGCYEGA